MIKDASFSRTKSFFEIAPWEYHGKATIIFIVDLLHYIYFIDEMLLFDKAFVNSVKKRTQFLF